MKRIGFALCVGAASLALIATAGARGRSHPTDVFYDASGPAEATQNQLYAAGHVTSPSAKCVANRTVKVLFNYEGERRFKLVDVAKSSRSGEFAGQGPDSHGGNAMTGVVFEVLKKKFGRKHHRKTCKEKVRAVAF